mmetsp:Transcript_48963/g.140725  ORF Transcript_48963/g.140725 Transcript_48963/m.140725 type:complete len:274 (-) Transcript_48963:1658-2479(-)
MSRLPVGRRPRRPPAPPGFVPLLALCAAACAAKTVGCTVSVTRSGITSSSSSVMHLRRLPVLQTRVWHATDGASPSPPGKSRPQEMTTASPELAPTESPNMKTSRRLSCCIRSTSTDSTIMKTTRTPGSRRIMLACKNCEVCASSCTALSIAPMSADLRNFASVRTLFILSAAPSAPASELRILQRNMPTTASKMARRLCLCRLFSTPFIFRRPQAARITGIMTCINRAPSCKRKNNATSTDRRCRLGRNPWSAPWIEYLFPPTLTAVASFSG